MKFIPELAGLRGLAALMVFVAHAAADGFLPRFIGNTYGRMGLMCFFVLSGYLIAQVYLYKPFSAAGVKSYLVARTARIVPVYMLILFAAYVISNFIYNDFHYDFTDKKKFLLSLLFINTPYEPWTIPVEVQFYFCFLFFWYLYSLQKINTVILFTLPVTLLLPSIVYAVMFNKIPHVFTSFSPFFSFGVLISFLHTKGHLEKFKRVPSFISFLLLIAFALIFPVLKKKTGLPGYGWYDPVGIPLVIFLFIMVIIKSEDFKILRVKSMIFMSEISYVFYLIHRPLMKITVEKFGTGLIACALLFTVCALLAWLIFKFFEVPARNLIELKLNKRDLTDPVSRYN